MATTGGQPGNQNARKAKIWEQALKRALARKSGSTVDAGLDLLASTIVNAAADGEQWAIIEIGARMDGKPAQAIIATGDEEGGPIRHSLTVGYADSPTPEG